jgi:membrane protein YqaA with SNARE-associated domain
MLAIPWHIAATLFAGAFVSTAAIAVIPHEPIIMWAGQRLGLITTAVVATAGTMVACWFDYRIVFPRLVPRLVRLGERHETVVSATGWAMRWFQRRRFATLALSGLTPLPFFPFKLMAKMDNYPLRRYVVAVAVGRFPRYLLLASVGAFLPIPSWAIAVFSLVLVGLAIVHHWVASRRSHKGPLL